jgi:hypothetical protein
VAPPRWEQARERQEGTIRRAKRRTSLLPAEHDQLMSQDEQLDVLDELTAPAPDQQPEHSREGEIGERKEHPPILATPEQLSSSRVRLQSVAQPSPNLVSRARETRKRRRPPEMRR